MIHPNLQVLVERLLLIREAENKQPIVHVDGDLLDLSTKISLGELVEAEVKFYSSYLVARTESIKFEK
jgi:hypothetical protein